MLSRIRDLVLNEPSGRPTAVVMFSGAFVFFGLYVSFGVFGDSSTIYELFIAGALATSGIAESLPKGRRRTAGVLRVTAILVLLLLLAILALAPELVHPR